MDEGKTEVAEVVAGTAPEVCGDSNCGSCTMIRTTLEAFENTVAFLFQELEKEQKSLGKIDLIAGVATDLGCAFGRIDKRVDLSKVAVRDAKDRYLAAATLMNINYEKISHLQMLAGIVKVN